MLFRSIDLEVSHPSTNGPAYVRRLDNDDKTMYSIELNKFQALFAAGGAYYDLPGLLLEEDERSEERRVGKECRSRWSPYH